MKGKTWFGTRGYETWVPTPAINPDYARGSFEASGQYVEGGFGVKGSKNSHAIYILSWPVTKTRDAVRLISDFADGVFDTKPGINLIYWIDPMARDKNVLNQGWGTPSLQTEDATPIITAVGGMGRPKAVTTPANSFRYPPRSAEYTQTADSETLEQYIPIPPGHSAWVGVHGDGSAAGRIVVQRVNGDITVGSPVVPTVLGLTAERANTEFSSVDSSGIVLQVAATVSPVTFTLYGLVVQILPNGVTPAVGDFISGQGHSGCQFVGKPSKTPYSAALDRVGMTARLAETGVWL